MRVNRLFGVVVASLLAANAYANVYVTWQASAGFFFTADSGTGILPSGESTIAQLIWSSDDIADPVDLADANFVSGNDVFLTSVELTNNDGLFEDYAFFTGIDFDDNGSQPADGFIYGRIFQDNAPGIDDWYYAGPVVAAIDKAPSGNPPDAPQLYNLNRDTVNGDAIDGGFSAQVVPEPTSIALMLLGAAIVGVRRRRR